jgi:hypothetical protein
MNVSALILEICRQCRERYTATLVPILRTSSRIRYVNCGLGHVQYNYSSPHTGYSIPLNVSALPMEIYRQFNVPYTVNIVPNTAHILQFTQFELWSRTYTMYLQFHIFRLQYSTERICAAIGDISTIQCASYSKRCAKYSAYPSDYAIWIVVPAIHSVISALHIQASIFNWTYLRRYWTHVDNTTSIMLQTWCQYSAQPSAYGMWTVDPALYSTITAPHIQASIFNWMYLLCYRRYIDNSMWVILQPWCQYSAHPPDHAIWTVVPDLYNELTALHIQDSIFNSTYLRRY